MEKLFEGAEAQIFEVNSDVLKKVRLEKTYRLPQIDVKLRKYRTKREFKVLTKLFEEKVRVPEPLKLLDKEFSFEMAKIKGDVLKEVLDKKLLDKAFDEIIKIHSLDIVHGDLTTLNMIAKGSDVFVIDFGLAEFSTKIEDKAVDLNLFFTCIRNEHPDYFKFKGELLDKYLKSVDRGVEILKRLEKIEHRGRNKN